MKIFIGADLVPTEENFELFNVGDVKALVGEKIKNIMDECDYRIFNLELALTDKDTPIQKAGPNIAAPTSTVKGIKALGVDLLGVSNNHILDHGYEGLISTFSVLEKYGINYVGAGLSKEEAKKPFFIEKDGVKVGCYACCEHEFSWCSDYGFGANGFDPFESLDDITDIKKQCDYLIVLYHGGKEHYRYPTPRLVKTCRKIVEKGADIVLCQHTHCVGTIEDYKTGKIIYGQGNFVFAKNYADISSWGEGFAVILDINKENASCDFVPFNKTDVGIEFDFNGEIIKGLNARSEQIKKAGFIEEKFEEMAEQTVVNRYVQHMLGYIPNELELKERLIPLFHYAECEVHHECLLTGLRAKGGFGKFGEFKIKENKEKK